MCLDSCGDSFYASSDNKTCMACKDSTNCKTCTDG